MKKLTFFALFFAFCAGCGRNSPEYAGLITARHGMVVSASPIASSVGVEVLRQGGNAVDAAVAVGYALAVVFPQAGNIGGGGFMVIRMAEGRTAAVDYREKAPLKAHRDMYLDSEGNVVPDLSLEGALSIGVPGTVAGFSLALDEFGTKSLESIVAPAVRLARDGFEVDARLARSLRSEAESFRRYPSTAAIFVRGDGYYKPGDTLVQEDLARTLGRITSEGPAGFYTGKTALLMEKTMERYGGIMTMEDLAAYKAVIRQPVTGNYRGYKIISMPPPSSGGVVLSAMLNILEGFDIAGIGHQTPQGIHLIAEAAKLAFADRAEYLGDPDFVNVPVAELLSKSYAAVRRAQIDPQRATPSSEVTHETLTGLFDLALVMAGEHGETTHYSIVDRWGNAVSNSFTLNGGYGAKLVVEGAGFFLNNEMDDFGAKPGAPNMFGLIHGEANVIAPEKRMLSSMAPTIVTKDGAPILVLGSPGGSRIITSVLQVILNVVDHGMNIGPAVALPRVHHQWLPDVLWYEENSLEVEVKEALEGFGHALRSRNSIGAVQAIKVDGREGLLIGAPDPRRGGAAAGY